MDYAVIVHSGKQYRVSEGNIIELDKVDLPTGQAIDFTDVRMLKGPDGVLFGRPSLENAKVTGRILGHYKGKKIVVFKYKRRKNYRRNAGHRQQYTRVKIENIIEQGN